jgi:hypothetical protein
MRKRPQESLGFEPYENQSEIPSRDLHDEIISNREKTNTFSRRNFVKNALAASAGIMGTAGAGFAAAPERTFAPVPSKPKLWITDLRCAIIGNSPIVRITTNQGVSGYGEAERAKNYLKPFVLFYKDYLMGEDPTDVERVMMKIRRLGSFKPWGAAVSAIEMALWDIAGKVADVPVYKLLGGKIRDRVRVYNGAVRFGMTNYYPEDYAVHMEKSRPPKKDSPSSNKALAFTVDSPQLFPISSMGILIFLQVRQKQRQAL